MSKTLPSTPNLDDDKNRHAFTPVQTDLVERLDLEADILTGQAPGSTDGNTDTVCSIAA